MPSDWGVVVPFNQVIIACNLNTLRNSGTFLKALVIYIVVTLAFNSVFSSFSMLFLAYKYEIDVMMH